MNIRTRRAAAVGALVAGGLLVTAGSAAAHVTAQPGTAQQGSFTKLIDWEPAEVLLDEHVREGGAPRPKPSRY